MGRGEGVVYLLQPYDFIGQIDGSTDCAIISYGDGHRTAKLPQIIFGNVHVPEKLTFHGRVPWRLYKDRQPR